LNTGYFGDLMQSIADRGRWLVGFPGALIGDRRNILALAEDLLSGRGEASGVALARDILAAYEGLPEHERTEVLGEFADRFGPNLDRLTAAARDYLDRPDLQTASELQSASEPRRQELIRRLNLAPGGTHQLVRMRQDLLAADRPDPALKALDRDFVHLFSAWFNRGFLVLRRIEWSTPANILEKIMRYEAVHAIKDWTDLRGRLEPPDRRLYAFFHPALVDEPLIFVEIALMREAPARIGPVLAPARHALAAAEATTAVFYSISNTQKGLAGVSFGNFLIKQVVEELKRELPRLDTFVTLSPASGFADWLDRERRSEASVVLGEEERRILEALDSPHWAEQPGTADAVDRVVAAAAAYYFCRAKGPAGRPLDPVARFHLGNGARLERLNWPGDTSAKGLREAAGLMVNYLYDPRSIEANHEAFANHGAVVAADAVERNLPVPTAQHATETARV
jgi:malonyl-CoA decarboxylase